MKKMFKIGSALVLATVLAACGGDNEATENETTETNETGAIFTPGTFEGQNADGDLLVEVTVSETEILDIVVHYDTESEIGQDGAEETAALIVEAGRADIEAVTGATSSSNSVIEAVEVALAEARN